ncbi:MAG: hypothetical protein IH919_10600 [Deltaproteobacteria bacterium]|nr:hypothetical protein [Deltaproteobacteria bacterium]MCH7913032.1 hypothetical protein [Deltaproteobacteria bacterium]
MDLFVGGFIPLILIGQGFTLGLAREKNNDENSREINQSNGGDGKRKRAVREDKEPRRERGQC